MNNMHANELLVSNLNFQGAYSQIGSNHRGSRDGHRENRSGRFIEVLRYEDRYPLRGSIHQKVCIAKPNVNLFALNNSYNRLSIDCFDQ